MFKLFLLDYIVVDKNISSLTGLSLFYNVFSTNMLSLTGQSRRDWILVE